MTAALRKDAMYAPTSPKTTSLAPPAGRPGAPARAGGLQRPAGKVAAARAKYATDGATGLSGGKLVVALYERLGADLTAAAAAIERRDIEGAHLALVHAQDIVESLDDALDPAAWAQAEQLSALYRHIDRELVVANIRKDAAAVARCQALVEPLAATWREAAEMTAVPS